jgi:hypothetical protein
MAAAGQRFGAVDFWRGFVLLCIFSNHIPGNLVEELTPRNFGLSDAAEAFIFLSGLSVAVCYGSRDPGDVAARCLKKSLSLYRTHLAMSFAALALFAFAAVASGLPDLLKPDGRETVFDGSGRGLVGLVALGHQLGYFNILPLYVLLMLWAPLPLMLARRHPGWALAASELIYLAARLGGLALPNWPEAGTWFFNPFAWQLTFTLGILAGVLFRERSVPYSAPVFTGALAILLASLVVLKDGFGLAPGLWEAFRDQFDAVKQDEGVFRLLHFMALAYVVHQLRLAALLGRGRIGAELERLGRHGLPVFAAGSLLCAGGQILMRLTDAAEAASPALVGLVYTLVGAGGLVVLARYLEWTSSTAGRVASSARVSSAALFSPPSPSPRRS